MKDIEIGNVSIDDISVGDLSIDAQTAREKMESIENLTETCAEEIGDQLKKIREYEKRWKEQWAFDSDAGYFFSIVFRSNEERNAFLAKHNLQLRHDDHIMYEEMKYIIRED